LSYTVYNFPRRGMTTFICPKRRRRQKKKRTTRIEKVQVQAVPHGIIPGLHGGGGGISPQPVLLIQMPAR
jgi:hypothetical protein